MGRIELGGTCNFRDLGGYEVAQGGRVRRGTLFRSDNLSGLETGAFHAFHALGIRTVVDLRTAHERGNRPNRLPRGSGLRLEHAPISIVPELERRWSVMDRARFVLGGHLARFDAKFLREAYRGLPGRAVPALRQVFSLLAKRDHAPMLVLCMGGKDRTGFCVAMLLRALGVSSETVMDDYCFTNVCAKDRVDSMLAATRFVCKIPLVSRVVREADLRAFLEARPEYLGAALETVDRDYGSVEGYLAGPVGLTQEARENLRAWLLEG
jgi:protein-tyrosine phosphatase